MNFAVRELTPTQRRAVERHKAFKADIARKAAELSQKVTAKAEPEPFDFEAWRNRQERINPLPKKDHWFEIIGEIEPQTKAVRIRDIQRLVAKEYQISINDMLSARRTLVLTRPRQVGYYLSKMLTLKSLPEIGRHFHRDHTSALSGIKKIGRLRKSDPALDERIRRLATMLGGSLV